MIGYVFIKYFFFTMLVMVFFVVVMSVKNKLPKKNRCFRCGNNISTGKD